MKNKIIDIMRNQKDNPESNFYLAILLSLIFGLVWLIVYKAGGTKYAWPHLVYIPLFLSAFFFKKIGGFLGGLVSGLLMGPLMPLDINKHINQSFINWTSRTLIFVAFGLTLGFIFQSICSYLTYQELKSNYNPVTNLPNQINLEKKLMNKSEIIKNLPWLV